MTSKRRQAPWIPIFCRWDIAFIIHKCVFWLLRFPSFSLRGKAQRKLRKDIREGNDNEEEEKQEKPAENKPKAKSKAKGRAKSKVVPEAKEKQEDALSEAEELEREEYAIKNQLRQEDDDARQEKETAANKKHTKGKKKKKKQAKVVAGHDAAVYEKKDDAADEECEKAKVPQGVKRRLDFEACLGAAADDEPGEAVQLTYCLIIL